MIKNILFFFLINVSVFSQVVINEIDADTPSTDKLEFIELKSATPNFSLNGYVLVFFNGSTNGLGNSSYYALDLDGYTTDVNGIIHFGNPTVSPYPDGLIPNTTIQNGPDVVGLYLANDTDFPLASLAVATNLVNALAYSNNSSVQPTAIMTALGLTVCINENQTVNVVTHSIQRKNDGTYEVKIPTPGANNDGSGVIFNGISMQILPIGNLTEGDSFSITFTTQTPVTGTTLIFSFFLTNGSFDNFDYTGNLSVTIPVGSSSAIKNITITDDTANEGDETMRLNIGVIPSAYSILNNNIDIRIHDNDNVVNNWGTPINPTYGQVFNAKPASYYDTLEGKTGAVLKQAIQDIIANPLVVREHTYSDVYNILKDADQNPANSSQVWLMYVEQPRSKIDIQVSNSNIGFWNREHIYAQSRGGFNLILEEPADGINVWTTTDANDITAGGTDAHHIRAEDGPENSLRNNRNYGVDYNGPSGSQGSWRGDVARSLFYMAVRYNGLNVVNGNPPEAPDGFIGDLATLLTWNVADKSDDFEMNRNNIIYTWQQNRNPFIDHPDLADHIWGTKVGLPWSSTLSNQDFSELKVAVYPNPTKDFIVINGLVDEADIEISSISGLKVYKGKYTNNQKLDLDFASGIYFLKISSDNKSLIKKIVVE
jgi:Endonuclease I/Secretion system C-terminal sorting domain